MPFKNIFLQSSICRKRENEIFSNSIRLKKKKKNILLSHDCRFVKDIPTSIIQKLSQRIWRIPPIPVYIFVATIKAGTGQTRLTAQFFFSSREHRHFFDFYPLLYLLLQTNDEIFRAARICKFLLPWITSATSISIYTFVYITYIYIFRKH